MLPPKQLHSGFEFRIIACLDLETNWKSKASTDGIKIVVAGYQRHSLDFRSLSKIDLNPFFLVLSGGDRTVVTELGPLVVLLFGWCRTFLDAF